MTTPPPPSTSSTLPSSSPLKMDELQGGFSQSRQELEDAAASKEQQSAGNAKNSAGNTKNSAGNAKRQPGAVCKEESKRRALLSPLTNQIPSLPPLSDALPQRFAIVL